jgi:hypothetical protein
MTNVKWCDFPRAPRADGRGPHCDVLGQRERVAWARSRGSLLRSRQEYDKIVPVDSVKQRARLFVKKIAIDRAAGQQCDSVVPQGMLRFEAFQLAAQRRNLMFVFVLGFKTALAVHRMPNEIAADQAGDAIKSQGIEGRARTPIYDHAARLTDPGKRSVNSSLPHPFSRITHPQASSQRPSNRDALGFRELAQFVAQGLAPGRLLHEGRDKIFRLAEVGREHHGFDGSD